MKTGPETAAGPPPHGLRPPGAPIPLVLVTGFLGSGKTTLLRRVIEAFRDRRFVYLVNDFASVDVDTRRLHDTGADVVSIPGGSIFCRCLVTEFVARLRRVTGDFDRPETPVEAVVVEASGMANPSALDDLLGDCGLAGAFAVRSVTVLIDPATFPKLLHTLPNVRRQVEAADLAVLNKCDLHDEAALQAAEGLLRGIRTDIEIVRAVRAEIGLARLFGAHGAGRHGDLAPCRDPGYEARALPMETPVDLEVLRHRLEAAGDAVYRAKGLVRTPAGLRDVDWSAGRFEARPWTGAADAAVGLAVIFRGTPSPETLALLDGPPGGGPAAP